MGVTVEAAPSRFHWQPVQVTAVGDKVLLPTRTDPRRLLVQLEVPLAASSLLVLTSSSSCSSSTTSGSTCSSTITRLMSFGVRKRATAGRRKSLRDFSYLLQSCTFVRVLEIGLCTMRCETVGAIGSRYTSRAAVAPAPWKDWS